MVSNLSVVYWSKSGASLVSAWQVFYLGTIILRCVNDRDSTDECQGLTEVHGIIGKISLPK